MPLSFLVMRRFPVPWYALVVAVAFCGCAHYEFRLVQPPNFAQTIGKQPVTIHYDPLDYRLAGRGDALSMRVVNPTDEPVTLLSAKTYVVDPAGETHPLRGRSIAPHSYVGMSLP